MTYSISKQKTKYCASCWRYEPHRPLKADPILIGAVSVLSLGVALLLWPYRCTTCGSVRPRVIATATRSHA